MIPGPLKHISAAQMFQGHGSKTTEETMPGNQDINYLYRHRKELRGCSTGSTLTILSQPFHHFSGVLKDMVEIEPNNICNFYVVSELQQQQ